MAFSFGAAANANKPAFGTATTSSSGALFGGFNSSTTSTSTGFNFGQTAPGAGTGFGFGTTGGATTGFGTGTSAFGTGTGTSTFGTATGTSAFGTGTGTTGFGAATGTTGFGTGTGTTGFGTATGTTGFGTGTGTTGFGAGTGTTGFGAGTGIGGSTFGTGGGTGLSAGFGTGTLGGGLGGGLGQPQQQQAQQQQNAAAALANMATAVSLPVIFGDERDAIIAKWNQLQSFWGAGKGFFNPQGQAVEFSPDNPFCRFKAVGYSHIPTTRNKDGLVAVILARKQAEVVSNQTQIVDSLHKMMGSKPTLFVCVDGVRTLPDDKTEITIYVQERSPTGTTRRLPALELYNFLNQNNIKMQLVSQLSVQAIIPKTGMTSEQMKKYLDTPPAGIDPLIWRQAKLDNPNTDKLIPVPMIGFSELHKRLKFQDQQTKLQQARLDVIGQDISTLQQNHTDMLAKIEQYKRKHLELGHRVLQVMVKQEVYRKLGYAIQADEEQLRVHLEAIQAELNAPTQFKGRLNELMSQMRMQNQLGGTRAEASYQMEPQVQSEIKQHLRQQQEGLQHLISIIKDDLEDLHLIEQGLVDTDHRR